MRAGMGPHGTESRLLRRWVALHGVTLMRLPSNCNTLPRAPRMPMLHPLRRQLGFGHYGDLCDSLIADA
jgi:hypothetical protein